MRYKNVPVIHGEWGAAQKDNCSVEFLSDEVHPMLAMFDLKYINSDHHVRLLAAGAKTGEPGSSLFCLSDQDDGIIGDDDMVSLRGKYMHIMPPYYFEGSERVASGIGRNTSITSVTIPVLGADEVFILRGFQFNGTKDRNHHLKQISVRFNPANSAIDVSFIDNSPEDDSYEFTVYYFVLKSICTDRGYNFCLRGIFTDTFEFRDTTSRLKPFNGKGLIAGFLFRFVDNDHHLKRIYIDQTPEDVYHVGFSDNEGGKLVSSVIDYILIQSTN